MLTLAIPPAIGTLGLQFPGSLQLPSLRPTQSDACAVPPPTTSAATIATALTIKPRIRPARDIRPPSWRRVTGGPPVDPAYRDRLSRESSAIEVSPIQM